MVALRLDIEDLDLPPARIGDDETSPAVGDNSGREQKRLTLSLETQYSSEKAFEKINLKRRDKFKLYFPPDAFHVYSELFKKLI